MILKFLKFLIRIEEKLVNVFFDTSDEEYQEYMETVEKHKKEVQHE